MITNEILYACYQLDVKFVNSSTGNVRDCSGTCFSVRDESGVPTIVTNRHNVDPTFKKPEDERYFLAAMNVRGFSRSATGVPERNVNFVIQSAMISYPSSKDDDIACVSVIKVFSNLSRDIRLDYSIASSDLAQEDYFQEKLHVLDELAFPSYQKPHDSAQGRPIMRKGYVSSDPRVNYSFKDVQNPNKSVMGSAIAYEAYSLPGSSGAPVVTLPVKLAIGQKRPGGLRGPAIIGVNAGSISVPNPNGSGPAYSGISYFYKSTSILEALTRLSTKTDIEGWESRAKIRG